MSSGYSGPGGPDFYSSGGINGRSVMNNAQPPYRSPQLPGILLDPAAQIVHRRPDLIGKRPLADFQGQAHHQFLNSYQYQHHQQHPQVNNGNLGVFPRSVKPRTHYHTSPISPLSPVDFNAAISPEMISSVSSTLAPPPPSGRYGLSLLRPQLNARGSSAALNGIVPEERKTTMNQQLQELEKQLLLDDDEDDKADSVSVITGSEWSGAIVPNFVSPSPTSSNASSSSSSSVASPPQACPKQSLLDAASAAAEGNPEKALEILTRVAQACDVKGRPDQRMAAHLAAGLRRRVVRVDEPTTFFDLRGLEHAAAMQKLYEVSPCFKLGLWAANQAILDATSDLPEKIHVVDFEGLQVGGASQYLNLVQQLVARRPEPPALKITCVASDHGHGSGGNSNGGCEEQLRKLGVKVSYKTLHLCDLSRDALGCEPGEALAVNLAFKLYGMPDESVRTDNPRDELLRRVKGLAPRVVAIVEQEMNGNTAPLVTRVGEVCSYYGALFDSLDSALPRESPERGRVEEALGRKMANTVACEGMERLERCEMFGKWRARLRMAGFEQRPLSQSVAESLVNSAPRGNVGVTVKEESGGIWLGWMGRTLAVASAWR